MLPIIIQFLQTIDSDAILTKDLRKWQIVRKFSTYINRDN